MSDISISEQPEEVVPDEDEGKKSVVSVDEDQDDAIDAPSPIHSDNEEGAESPKSISPQPSIMEITSKELEKDEDETPPESPKEGSQTEIQNSSDDDQQKQGDDDEAEEDEKSQDSSPEQTGDEGEEDEEEEEEFEKEAQEDEEPNTKPSILPEIEPGKRGVSFSPVETQDGPDRKSTQTTPQGENELEGESHSKSASSQSLAPKPSVLESGKSPQPSPLPLSPNPAVAQQEEEGAPKPTFICHEASYTPNPVVGTGKKGRRASREVAESDDDDLEFYPQLPETKKYAKLNHFDMEYRPAALSAFPTVIREMTALAHSELIKRGCQRLQPEKVKHEGHDEVKGRSHHKLRLSHLKMPHEAMEKKMARLKIYRRVFGSLVLYFRAYAPLLFYIKKSYDDVLNFRLKQFKEAHHERMKIHHERTTLEHKMSSYQFPDFKRLLKSEEYLNLLFTRIKKQDEAIQFVTGILTRMERSLSEHYEKYRDMEDQIKMLDHEISENSHHHSHPRKKQKDATADDKKGGLSGIESLYLEDDNEDDGMDEPIDENEVIDDDKRMVLILAYSVAMTDLEEARKKLKSYEAKYQHVAPRHELESAKENIILEKSQVKVLADNLKSLEKEYAQLKTIEHDAEIEIKELKMMDPENFAILKIKFTEEMEKKAKEKLALEEAERLRKEQEEQEEEASDEEEEEDEEDEEEGNEEEHETGDDIDFLMGLY